MLLDYERIKLWNFGTFLNFFAFYFINLLAIDQLVSLLSIRFFFVWLMAREEASLGSVEAFEAPKRGEENEREFLRRKRRVLLSFAEFYNF